MEGELREEMITRGPCAFTNLCKYPEFSLQLSLETN